MQSYLDMILARGWYDGDLPTDQDVADSIRRVSVHYVDLVITAGNVAWVSGPAPIVVLAGAAFTAGQTGYLDTSVNKFKLADANATAGIINYPSIVALSSGADGVYMLAAQAGTIINIGATIAKATSYFQSATPGGMAPLADVASGWVVVEIGKGITTANLLLTFQQAGFTF